MNMVNEQFFGYCLYDYVKEEKTMEPIIAPETIPPKPPLPDTVPPKPTKTKNQLLPALIITGLLSATIGAGAGVTTMALTETHPVTTSGVQEATTTANSNTTNTTAAIQKALPSIVTVSVTSTSGSGTGSGVVINQKEGYIVTNAHVATLGGLTDKGTITIQDSTGEIHTATLVAYDSTADLAVLKTDANLPQITFGTSSTLQVGDETIAIGAPLGLTSTTTTGIVSALNRPIAVESSEIQTNQQQTSPWGEQQTPTDTIALNVIQTDASINSGNSGGALLDANGNLIGINVAMASTDSSTGSIGLGFAIPSDYVKRIVTELVETGETTHGVLGVGTQDATETNSSFTTGAIVVQIQQDSPAETAGVKEGDVILKVGNQPITSSVQLSAYIKQLEPGTEVVVTVSRDGKETPIQVTVG